MDTMDRASYKFLTRRSPSPGWESQNQVHLAWSAIENELQSPIFHMRALTIGWEPISPHFYPYFILQLQWESPHFENRSGGVKRAPIQEKKAKPGPFGHPPSSQTHWVHDYGQDYRLLRAGPLYSWQTLEKSLIHPELQQPVKAILEIAARQERCFLPSSSAGTARAVLTSSNTQTCFFLNPNNNNKKQQNPTIIFLAMYPPCHDDPDI